METGLQRGWGEASQCISLTGYHVRSWYRPYGIQCLKRKTNISRSVRWRVCSCVATEVLWRGGTRVCVGDTQGMCWPRDSNSVCHETEMLGWEIKDGKDLNRWLGRDERRVLSRNNNPYWNKGTSDEVSTVGSPGTGNMAHSEWTERKLDQAAFDRAADSIARAGELWRKIRKLVIDLSEGNPVLLRTDQILNFGSFLASPASLLSHQGSTCRCHRQAPSPSPGEPGHHMYTTYSRKASSCHVCIPTWSQTSDNNHLRL